MKFVYASAPLQDAEFVLIGVPDESGNRSPRTGSKRGPDAIRKVAYERCVFKKKGTFSSTPVDSGKFVQKIHDYGNVDKKKLGKVIEVLKDKIPIVLGGDHSITAEVIKQFPDVTVIYFDAHPGILSSLQGYYGSVLTDTEINFGKCIQIGVREPEIEELKHIKKEVLLSISVEEVYEKGVSAVFKEIKKVVQGKVYLSVDLNVFDPAFAPGVSTPVPGGLHYHQVIPFVKNILSEFDVVGFDIMELSPSYDQDQRTAHLAVKLLLEMIVNYKKK
ncbi:MAG: arginase family protein [bacterium]|nr:arginase family protein [bacterium]